MLRIFLIFSIGILLTASAQAQGWQRYYGGNRLLAGNLSGDGSLLAVGNCTLPDGSNAGYFLHTDVGGGVLLEGSVPEGSVTGTSDAGNGVWRLYGYRASDTLFSVLTDGSGATMLGPGRCYRTVSWPGGGAVLCGALPQEGSSLAFTLKTNADGQLLWQQTDTIGASAVATAIAISAAQEVITAGNVVRSQDMPDADIFLSKRTGNGAEIFVRTYPLPHREEAAAVLELPDGRILIVGSIQHQPDADNTGTDIWLSLFDASGNLTDEYSIPLPGYEVVRSAALLPDGRIALAGETRPEYEGSRDAFLALLDVEGNLLWFKKTGGVKGDIAHAVYALPNGGFVLAGQTASVADGKLHAWVARADSSGNIWSNRVQGHVRRDANPTDCTVTPDEAALADWWVTAAGPAGIWHTRTDANGYYQIPADTGIWYVSVLPPAGYWMPCADSIPVYFSASMDSATVDIAVQALYECPLMQVDISTPYLRRCFENTWQVSWFNYGTAPADDARIAVVLDDDLVFIGSPSGGNMVGDTLWLEVGDVPALTGGSTSFSALPDCDNTVLGQTHCVMAHIFPDSICQAFSAEWDGSQLAVQGRCEGDSVVLIIANIGSGDMQDAVEYIITEDQIIFKRAPILLPAGQQDTVVVYPQGATVTLTVPQSSGFPGYSQPVAVVEGCGGLPFSTGYALQFPTDDGSPFDDTECRVNIGSFDPNDKAGLPLGVNGVVEAGTAIEYLIRFQNTGTDTAFRVEIRDTLSPLLDITTFEQGGSSHPVRAIWDGSGVVRFVFSPVALPDSATNAEASQGFVKYRIQTRRDLPDGAVVNNSAAIYFDFNAPVMTAATRHVIGDPREALTPSETTIVANAQEQLTAYPNPVNDWLYLHWKTSLSPPYFVECYDVTGRLHHTEKVETNTAALRPGIFFPGLWSVKVHSSGVNIGFIKIMVNQN